MESFLSKGTSTMWNGTAGGPGGEDSVHAGGAHRVIAFRIDEELKGGVEVAVRFANRADVCGGVILS